MHELQSPTVHAEHVGLIWHDDYLRLLQETCSYTIFTTYRYLVQQYQVFNASYILRVRGTIVVWIQRFHSLRGTQYVRRGRLVCDMSRTRSTLRTEHLCPRNGPQLQMQIDS